MEQAGFWPPPTDQWAVAISELACDLQFRAGAKEGSQGRCLVALLMLADPVLRRAHADLADKQSRGAGLGRVDNRGYDRVVFVCLADQPAFAADQFQSIAAGERLLNFAADGAGDRFRNARNCMSCSNRSFFSVEFISNDANVPRGFDPDADRITLHPKDRDLDVVADLDRFVEFASENEHGNLHFADVALIRCVSVSFPDLAGRV